MVLAQEGAVLSVENEGFNKCWTRDTVQEIFGLGQGHIVNDNVTWWRATTEIIISIVAFLVVNQTQMAGLMVSSLVIKLPFLN